jgi:hypothetical protein
VIGVFLRDLRWRLAFVLLLSTALYALEPAFHQHDGRDMEAVGLGSIGIATTMAYFSAIAMIVLLAGFVSGDRRMGYTRLQFSQPTSPLAYYGVRWGLAYGLSLVSSLLFLIIGQLIAWGRFEGGWTGLVLPALSALIYGGMMAFFSVALPRADAWVVFLLFLPTLLPQILTFALSPLSVAARRGILFILPPHGALQSVWEGLLLSSFDWGAVGFAAGYGLVFISAAILLLRFQEWP